MVADGGERPLAVEGLSFRQGVPKIFLMMDIGGASTGKKLSNIASIPGINHNEISNFDYRHRIYVDEMIYKGSLSLIFCFSDL